MTPEEMAALCDALSALAFRRPDPDVIWDEAVNPLDGTKLWYVRKAGW